MTVYSPKFQSIYALVDPRNDRVFYVGRAAYPEVRYRRHVVRSNATRINGYVNELEAAGYMPRLDILEPNVPAEDASKREMAWIRHMALRGEPLLNRNGVPSDRNVTN